MTRTGVLRAGYGGLGLAFAGLAASIYVEALVLPAFLLALVGGVLLAFSDDPLPKWAGIVLLSYFVFTVLVFVAATPITIDKGDGYFINAAPMDVARAAFDWLVLAAPLMLVGAALLSAWEREMPARILLFGALAGFLLVAVLSVALRPQDVSFEEAERQGSLTRTLFAVSSAAGAAGMLWAAARPDELA